MRSTIYILAPAEYKTGGTELAHQLVKLYTELQVNVYIAYVGVRAGTDPVNPAFKEYIQKWTRLENVDDSTDSILIIPESMTEAAVRFEKAKKIIWWMSVDFFEKWNSIRGVAKHFGIARAVWWRLKGKTHNKMPEIRCADLHLYQSEYARLWLEGNKIKNVLPLSDYINDSYFEEHIPVERENIVLYNPKKGYEYTKKIISKAPDLTWVPLQNMTTSQVGEMLRKSKVYVDFGGHPGKDRFPREAAISGCCIITGKRGAAANDKDVMIPSSYKFADKDNNISDIVASIMRCVQNYEECVHDFDVYRAHIRKEKELFRKDAITVLERIQNLTN